MEIENELNFEDALRILFSTSSSPITTIQVTDPSSIKIKTLQTDSQIQQEFTSSIDSSVSASSYIRPGLYVAMTIFFILLSIFMSLLIVPLFNWVRSKYFSSPPIRPSFVLSNVSVSLNIFIEKLIILFRF